MENLGKLDGVVYAWLNDSHTDKHHLIFIIIGL